MKIKTSELTGAALDWVVAKCQGWGLKDTNFLEYNNFATARELGAFNYSIAWGVGGPIIERELIYVSPYLDGDIAWSARKNDAFMRGSTPLIAAMRCYVASKLGDEVEIPKELV